MSNTEVIFIVGPGRSGTSAVTRVLSLCGCSLPQTLFPARDDNPRGFWEPVDAARLNVEFAFRHGKSFVNMMTRLDDEIVCDATEKESYIGRIKEFLAECPPGLALVIKCVYLTGLLKLWSEAANRAGLSVKVVIPIRHPGEVFASLQERAGPNESLELIGFGWLGEILLAERHTRCFPRVFVEYSNLLDSFRQELVRISGALSIKLNIDDPSISDFLTRDLHRHRRSGQIPEPLGHSWNSRVYGILSAAAQDRPVATWDLDEIRTEYCACGKISELWTNQALTGLDIFSPENVSKEYENLRVWKLGRDF